MPTEKKDAIVLISIKKEKGKEIKVPIEQALNLMRMQEGKKSKNNWSITDKSYIFKNNEIQKRTNSK